MCRVGQRVNGQKQYLAISFFSPSAENQNWKKGQTPTILPKPSASERMIPFLMNEIFQFQSVDDAGNAAPYIEAYYNKSKCFPLSYRYYNLILVMENRQGGRRR